MKKIMAVDYNGKSYVVSYDDKRDSFSMQDHDQKKVTDKDVSALNKERIAGHYDKLTGEETPRTVAWAAVATIDGTKKHRWIIAATVAVAAMGLLVGVLA